MPLLGRPAIPSRRFPSVPGDTLAVGVEKPDRVLRPHLALLGRQAHQPHRLGLVVRHALSDRMQVREAVLPRRVALLRRPAIPPRRLGGVPGNTLAAQIQVGDCRLRAGIALLRTGAQRPEVEVALLPRRRRAGGRMTARQGQNGDDDALEQQLSGAHVLPRTAAESCRSDHPGAHP